jgi:hypothetical protein
VKRADVQYAVSHLLPDGWQVDDVRITVDDDFVAVARRGRESRRISIPVDVTDMPVQQAVAIITNAIDKAFAQGRYATTAIVTVGSAWSPYP